MGGPDYKNELRDILKAKIAHILVILFLVASCWFLLLFCCLLLLSLWHWAFVSFCCLLLVFRCFLFVSCWLGFLYLLQQKSFFVDALHCCLSFLFDVAFCFFLGASCSFFVRVSFLLFEVSVFDENAWQLYLIFFKAALYGRLSRKREKMTKKYSDLGK